MKIAVARFWHEGNSFAPTTVGFPAFEAREWLRGDEVPVALRGTAGEIGGALDWAEAQGARLSFSRCAAVEPGGPVEQEVLDAWTAEVLDDPVFAAADGIYLSLHGAAIGTRDLAPEERVCVALRAKYPDLPIVASFDLHACPTEALAGALNAATVYRTYPHVDMDVAARDALDLLAGMIETGARHRVLRRAIGRILPSHNMRTAPGLPMTEIEEIAQSVAGEGVLCAYPFASFAYADIPGADAGVLVTCSDTAAGEAAADRVCAAMFARRERFRPVLESAAAIIARRPWEAGPTAIVEPSDNPLSGGGADTPGLFAAALAARDTLPAGTVFAFFHDPDLVVRARAEGPGAVIQTTLGARHTRDFGAPVPVTLTVERLTDGRFTSAGPMFKGQRMALGDTAVLTCGPMRIIVSSLCVTPNDRNYFLLHGIDVDKVPLMLAKAKNHFTAAFGAVFPRVIQADTPGPAQADATALPFRKVPQSRLSLD